MLVRCCLLVITILGCPILGWAQTGERVYDQLDPAIRDLVVHKPKLLSEVSRQATSNRYPTTQRDARWNAFWPSPGNQWMADSTSTIWTRDGAGQLLRCTHWSFIAMDSTDQIRYYSPSTGQDTILTYSTWQNGRWLLGRVNLFRDLGDSTISSGRLIDWRAAPRVTYYNDTIKRYDANRRLLSVSFNIRDSLFRLTGSSKWIYEYAGSSPYYFRMTEYGVNSRDSLLPFTRENNVSWLDSAGNLMQMDVTYEWWQGGWDPRTRVVRSNMHDGYRQLILVFDHGNEEYRWRNSYFYPNTDSAMRYDEAYSPSSPYWTLLGYEGYLHDTAAHTLYYNTYYYEPNIQGFAIQNSYKSRNIYSNGELVRKISYHLRTPDTVYTPDAKTDFVDYLITESKPSSKVNSLRVVPNPIHGIASVFIPNGMEGGQIVVIDITGREILKRTCCNNHEQVDLGQFPKGLYQIRFDGFKISATSRVVLE